MVAERKRPGRELNDRQRACLQIIYALDLENERYFTEEWDAAAQGEPPPAKQWRWIYYDSPNAQKETELKQRLRQANVSGAGTKATLKALWAKGLLRLRHERLGRNLVLSLQLTAAGRRLAKL